ncbi:methyl-accepting chemotaxis protein [Celerinatantimonas diazotrophica]|uniref:Methyl-accepting chemotaxis sensory transducer with Cache sensor n=1 Tax=Celerinatantimonas diazotrophica TaxID=412034 RepID=A0A4R1J7Y2_9GAMM|nr:methyl-accepting chemotaxis protein [Celerinatantimonas diazotrophica]TCK46480.1 methyl-accepting chemotaxis sensory transducer with Cache sensor [Celerinatantimonas diazotrophica]CAG9296530.1 Methyl-accepting chemotaxis protein PctC [Celerinatantimonas diazotrophica]
MEYKKGLSLKLKLSVAATVAILIGCLAVMIVSFFSSITQRTDVLDKQLQSLTTNYNHYVKDWIDARSRALKAIPNKIPADNMLATLKQVRDSAGFSNVFIAYSDGSEQNAGQVKLAADNNDPRTWGWYKNASKDPGTLYMDNPSVASATGENVVSFGLAKEVNSQQVVFGADMSMSKILVLLKSAQLPGEGQVLIANQQGNIFAYQNTQLLNQPVDSIAHKLTKAKLAELSQSNQMVNMDIGGQDSYVMVSPIANSRLYTVVVINKDSILSPLYNSLWSQIAVALVVAIICIILFNIYSYHLLKALTVVSEALAKIAKGGGDLTQRIKVSNRDEVGMLANNFNQFISTLQGLIADLRKDISELRDAAKSSEQRANGTAKRLNEQQRDVTSVATAVEEMASATAEIASHAQHTLESVGEATNKASEGSQLVESNRQSIDTLANSVEQTSQVIGELHEHAQNINDILTAIQTIAEQTNLLALNAAIEAARAGEQGRGFAVVADEVRNLSQRTQSSTEQIQSTITTLLSITDRAVSMMQKSYENSQHTVEDASKAAEALSQIDQAVQVISDMNAQIATAAEEQAQVTTDVTTNSARIKDVTDELVVDATEAREHSVDLDGRAERLAHKIAEFKID